ncbi:MAG: MmgE/PrpD family protein, partial [Dehalococcoidales bacterium]|nr:MmgE/PrpD family protein [Dehalococcoidales bacterium]
TARFEDIDPNTLKMAKLRIIDTLGCLIGGASDSGNPELVRLTKEKGGKKEATILIYGGKVPLTEAALVNCILARSFDFEPVSPLVEGESYPGHISGTTVPAAFTIAETVGAGGRDLLTAMLLGDDIATRLLVASGFGFSLGWDGVGTVNVFAATAIAGRLLGLNEKALRNAFGIALNLLGTTFQSFWDGTTAFKLPQGLAARSGIFACQLAQAGWTGPVDPLFGRFGYYKMFTEGCHKPEALTKDLGKKFYSDGTFKPYPCCRIPHAAIQAALTLVKKHDLKPADIASAVLEVAPGGIEHVCGHPFRIGEFPHGNAAFSYQYVVARAFVSGAVKPEHFTEKAIREPEVNEFVRRIRLVAADDVPFEKARLTVELNDGRKLTETVLNVKGDPLTSPMTEQEIIDKFWMNVEFGGRISRRKAEELLKDLLQLEEVPSIRRLVPLLTA